MHTHTRTIQNYTYMYEDCSKFFTKTYIDWYFMYCDLPFNWEFPKGFQRFSGSKGKQYKHSLRTVGPIKLLIYENICIYIHIYIYIVDLPVYWHKIHIKKTKTYLTHTRAHQKALPWPISPQVWPITCRRSISKTAARRTLRNVLCLQLCFDFRVSLAL